MDIRDYTEKYAAHYRGSGPGWFEATLVGIRRRQVIASLERHRHARVLEVGCGMEPLFAYWTGFPRLTVVEPSPGFVANARALASARAGSAAGAQVDVVQGFLEEVTEQLAGAAPLDFVVASSLLHEVGDPERFLRTLHTLATPETVLHINVPNVHSFHRLLALEMGLIADLFEQSETEKSFQRTTRFDRTKLEAMMVAAGFELLRFGTYFVKPFTHAQMERLIDEKILPPEAVLGFERMSTHLPDMGAEMFVEIRRR
jgi:SAM-dependent methyltransferase